MTAKDSRHAEKASRGKESAMVEMWNAKNVYLLSIEVSNRMLHKYFEKDLPQIHDDMQALWTTIMARFKNIMKKQCTATTRQYEVLQRYNENGLKVITAIDAEKDQALFVDYNKRSFFPPPDFTFEPCTIWHDNSNFSLEVEPKTFLQNKLAKDENDLDEVLPRVQSLRKEVTKLDELRKAYIENPALGDLDSVVEQYFHSVQEAVSAETQQETLEAEIDILHETLGDDTHPTGQAHDFKASSFPVSKTCYVCQGKIWGMGKVGLSCRECGTNIHTNCQLLCPADCGEPSLDLARASTRASIQSSPNVSSSDGASLNRRTSYAPSMRSQRSANGSMSSLPSSTQTAKAIYDYDAQSASQLSITAGESLTVITPDKGNGWTKVSNEQGQTGICPTNYLNMRSGGPPPPPLSRRPAAASASSSSSNLASYGTVTAMYAYTAGSPQELSINKGDVLELTAKGSQYAAGWTEVVKNGQKGIVPTSYVS
ncbi:hypothetical protein P389DRAFT_30981 [Cystobasidium minutum MCA 4210]|uniref:uncharacterized protein n=1 Tax=Cystobasidium minutum MCA 4210 TaxID=1397322 RepID=UPI0034CF6F1D|eukprot:jgi/Rhomi1/30981/CE30980_669